MFNNFPPTQEVAQLPTFIGVVEDVQDSMKLGRARVRIFGLHPEDRTEVPTWSLPWAMVLTPTTSASVSGIGVTPQLVEGSWVFGFLLDGDKAQFPLIIGTFPGQHNSNAPGYGGAAPVESGYNNSQYIGESAVTGETPAQYNNVDQSQPIADDGAFLTQRDANTVRFNNYQLRDFSPRYYNNPRFRFHKATAFAFDKATTEFGRKLTINSGWRTFGDQRRHPQGRALDISIRNMSPEDVYRLINILAQCGFSSFGIEYTYIHVDTADHLPGLLYAYPRQGAPRGSSATFNNRTRTGRLEHSRILQALNQAGWRRGRTKAFEISSRTAASAAAASNPPGAAAIDQNAVNSLGTATTNIRNNSTDNFAKTGFRDPTNSFPSNDYRGVSSVNQAARGLNDDLAQHVALGRENGRTVNFPIASGRGTFGEPQIPYNAQYPYNYVISSRGGHMIEMDSTPRSERLHIYSPSGTYTEIDAYGTQVNKVIGDRVVISNRNDYHGVKGDYALSVDGEVAVRSGTDSFYHTEGNMNITVRNDNSIQISGDYLLRVGDDIRIKATNVYIEADNLHFLAKETLHLRGKNIEMYADEKIRQTAKGDIEAKTEAEFKATAKGDLNLKTDGDAKMTASGASSIHAGGNVYVDGSQVRLAEQGSDASEASEAAKANDTNIPGGNLSRAEVRVRPNYPAGEINPPRISDGVRTLSGGGGSSSGPMYSSGDINDPAGSVTTTTQRSQEPRRIPTGGEAVSTNVTDQSLSPQAKALLDTIAAKESGGAYNVINGGETFSNFSDHPRRRGRDSTAAGRYQFVVGTWDFVSSSAGIRDFTPISQDRAAWWYARQITGGDVQADLEAGNLVRVKRALGSSRGWEAITKMSQQEFESRYYANLRKYTQVDDNVADTPEVDDGGLDTSTNTTAPQNENQSDEFVMDLQSPVGIRNFLNGAPVRQANTQLQIKSVPDDTVVSLHEAARRANVPADILIQVASWRNPSLQLSSEAFQRLALELKTRHAQLQQALERAPTNAHVLIAMELNVQKAVDLIKKAEDRSQRNQETDIAEVMQKEDGPNQNEKRSHFEAYQRYSDRLINPRLIVSTRNDV